MLLSIHVTTNGDTVRLQPSLFSTLLCTRLGRSLVTLGPGRSLGAHHNELFHLRATTTLITMFGFIVFLDCRYCLAESISTWSVQILQSRTRPWRGAAIFQGWSDLSSTSS